MIGRPDMLMIANAPAELRKARADRWHFCGRIQPRDAPPPRVNFHCRPCRDAEPPVMVSPGPEVREPASVAELRAFSIASGPAVRRFFTVYFGRCPRGHANYANAADCDDFVVVMLIEDRERLRRKTVVHETAWDAADAFERGDIVNTIEMGGLGPGYELTIQAAAFALIRNVPKGRYDEKRLIAVMDQIEPSMLGPIGSELSGTQWAAARNLASNAVLHGWQAMIHRAKKAGISDDRLILVAKHVPPTELPQQVTEVADGA